MLNIHSIALVCAGLTLIPTLAMADEEDKLLEKTKVSMTSAVAATEKSTGGKVMDIELDDEKGTPVYEVATLVAGKLKHLKLDASAKGSAPVESKSLVDKMKMEGKDEQDAAMQAKTSIADAIMAVEKETGGKALEAKIEVEDKKATYVVEVFANGKEMKRSVDVATGKIVSKP